MCMYVCTIELLYCIRVYECICANRVEDFIGFVVENRGSLDV